MTKTVINTPEALSIAREITADILSMDVKRKELEALLSKEYRDFCMQKEALIKENYERLRLSLNLPKMDDPVLDAQYLEHNIAFVHHGDEPACKSAEKAQAFFEKLMGGHREH